jgi:hypothetical protein
MTTLHLIVAGSREWRDYARMVRKLDHLTQNYDEVVVVSGCAIGADTLGERWARSRGHTVAQFPADWRNQGKKAGNLRNLVMLDYVQSQEHCAVAVFWNGTSKGSKHMILTSEIRGVPLRVIRPEVKRS